MKHLIIADYGTFLGLDSHRLAVKQDGAIKYFPLNRLCTVSIAKRGVSFSSDIVEALSVRGIKLFFLDFRGVVHSALVGQGQHAVVAIRNAQLQFGKQPNQQLANNIIIAKIKNQRAVLSYFNKYHQSDILLAAIDSLQQNAIQAKTAKTIETLMGFEGASASSYFSALRQTKLFSASFEKREGRGSVEINNSMLNLGYAVLSSYILNAVINAGLEPYLGVIHASRPGKMALVLDLIEEYRAWVVDRAVVKLRKQSEGKSSLSIDLKKNLIAEIQATCAKKYPYRNKKVKLEHIIQRQVYRLCGQFYGEKSYKPYLI